MKNLIRSTIAAVSVLAFAGVSQSADIIVEADPVVQLQAPNFSWTGMYAGIQGGYFDTSVDSAPGSQSSGNLGGYAGYNYQINNRFVLGVEGDYNKAFGTYGGFGYELSSFGSLRGRAGYAMDRTMVFATGGLALMDYERSTGAGDPGLETGYALGAGVEHMFMDNISAKAEYLYMNFSDTFEDVGAPAGISTDIHNVRVGVGYHF